MADRADDRDERLRRAFEAKAANDVDYLIGALRDPDVRGIVAKWLGQTGDRRSGRPLMLLLDAADPHARASAATALGALRFGDASAKLLELAERDPVPWVRGWALEALARMQERKAVALFVALLDDRDRHMRRFAAKCLGEIGDAEATEPLTRAAAGERWFARRAHRRALRAIRSAA